MWTKIDDALPVNAKMRGLSDAAWRFDLTAWAWSSSQGSDGHIPAADIPLLGALQGLADPTLLLSELKVKRRWEDASELCDRCAARYVELDHTFTAGYVLHDWLEFNPTAQQVEAVRAAKAANGRMGGRPKKADQNLDAFQVGVADAEPTAQADVKPYPSRPVPKDPVPTSSANADTAHAIFDYFREQIQPKARPLPAALAKIATRQKTFADTELMAAVDHFAADDWQMSHNENRGAAWFFASDQRVEGYLHLAPRPEEAEEAQVHSSPVLELKQTGALSPIRPIRRAAQSDPGPSRFEEEIARMAS